MTIHIVQVGVSMMVMAVPMIVIMMIMPVVMMVIIGSRHFVLQPAVDIRNLA